MFDNFIIKQKVPSIIYSIHSHIKQILFKLIIQF